MPNLFRHPTGQVFFVFKIAFAGINNHRPAHSPRVGFVLFLDKKNQKSSQQGGFFAALANPHAFAWPLPCRSGRTTGCNYFALPALSPCFCKNLLCPCSRTRPPLFYPLSPEAYLLTKRGEEARFREVRTKKHTMVKIQETKFTITQNGIYRNINTITNPKAKAGKGLTEKRAREYGLWGEAFFCLGFLVTFGPSQK